MARALDRQPTYPGIRIGEIWIDSVTFAQALDAIDELVTSGNGGFVVTPNVDHVVGVERLVELRRAYDAASLVLVDGQPLVWASYLLGAPLPEKISGSDLVLPLMKRAAQRRWRVYLIGGSPGVAEEVAQRLQSELGVTIVGIDAPRISENATPEEVSTLSEKISRVSPNLVFVAFGTPKGEVFMHRVASKIRPAVAVGVGAALDFLAGRVRRAPAWMSQAGLEWLFRLTQEPTRLWRRYLINDPKFLLSLYRTLRLPKKERVLEAPAK